MNLTPQQSTAVQNACGLTEDQLTALQGTASSGGVDDVLDAILLKLAEMLADA